MASGRVAAEDLRALQEKIATTPYAPYPALLGPASAGWVRQMLGLAPDTPITWDHLVALDAVRRG